MSATLSSTSASADAARKPSPRAAAFSAAKGDEVLGLVYFAGAVLFLLAFASYHPQDPTLLHRVDAGGPTRNLIGSVGAHLAALGFGLVGLAALAVPIAFAIGAWRRLGKGERTPVPGRGFGVSAALLALPALLHYVVGRLPFRGDEIAAGGALGQVSWELIAGRLNAGGAMVVLLTLLVVGASLAVQSTLGDTLAVFGRRLGDLRDLVLRRAERQRKARQREEVERRIVERQRDRLHEERRRRAGNGDEAVDPGADGLLPGPVRVVRREGEGGFRIRRVSGAPADLEPPADLPGPTAPPPAPRRAGPPPSPLAAAPRTAVPTVALRPIQPPGQERVAMQAPIDFGPDAPAASELPPVNLLQTEPWAREHDENELVRLGETICSSCAEFGVDGSLEGISPGPVITVYELQPAPGVKVSRIVNLQDDLALALKAESVRIDRMPGRSTLGIEVPNRARSVIHLGRLLSDDKFVKAGSVLTMALGVDIYGHPVYADLATMPHLLVAGATGAGKSVGLQSMITSIIYKATREQVQFIFIDPKRIELGVYADIPHLKTEVVVEPKKAANALRWSVAEMERRYRLLAEVHVRSIDYYNRAIRDPKERERLALREGESELTPEDFKPLPYYVIIIDELADLMMVAGPDVETSIARLAQMARAVGIHLIVATQRPSVDVLTGTIKANFPCRLAYATASRHDSRTILDQVGSEKLLGKGDALFMPPGTSRIQRLHGAYISEQETASLIRWLKRRGKPELDMDVVKSMDGDGPGGGGEGGGDDDLFDEAARLVVQERIGSASFLQRRLRVGFSRASRLIDMMEADGLLGPSQGSKPREVLVPPSYFDEIDRARAGEA